MPSSHGSNESLTGVSPLVIPHQQRVVEEKAQLDTKISKLSDFIGTAYFRRIPPEEQNRLASQLYHMNRYSAVLGERIAAFK